jgi:hypothetical protein
MPHVSFARDIKPLFRAVDIAHMKRYKINLDDYTSCRIRTMLTKCLQHFRRTMAIRQLCHPAGPTGQRTSSRCSPNGRRTDTSRKPHPWLLKKFQYLDTHPSS